jgi:hypothetical protein
LLKFLERVLKKVMSMTFKSQEKAPIIVLDKL